MLRADNAGRCLQKHLNACLVAVLTCQHLCRIPVGVNNLGVGACLQQRLHACLVTFLARRHQRRKAGGAGAVRIGARLDKGQ